MLFNSKNGVGRVFMLGVVACEMGPCLTKEDGARDSLVEDQDARASLDEGQDAGAPLVEHQHANGAPVTKLPRWLTEPLPQRSDSSTGESSSDDDVSDSSTEELPAPGSVGEKLNELQRCFKENSSRIRRKGLNPSEFESAIEDIKGHIRRNNAGQAIDKLQTMAGQIHAIRLSPYNVGRYHNLNLFADYNALSKIIVKIRQVIENLGGTMPPEQAPEQALSPAQPLSPPAPQPTWPGTDPK